MKIIDINKGDVTTVFVSDETDKKQQELRIVYADILNNINYEEGKVVLIYLLSHVKLLSVDTLQDNTLYMEIYVNGIKLRLSMNKELSKTKRITHDTFQAEMVNYINNYTILCPFRKIYYVDAHNNIVTDFEKRVINQTVFCVITNISYCPINIYKDINNVQPCFLLEILFSSIIIKYRCIKIIDNDLKLAVKQVTYNRLYLFKGKYYLIKSRYAPVMTNINTTSSSEATCILLDLVSHITDNVSITKICKQYEIEDITKIDGKMKIYHVV